MTRTSITHPLRIATIATRGGGRIGVTFCPGKHQVDAVTSSWRRDLEIDLQAVVTWGATALVSLITQAEMTALNVATLGDMAAKAGLVWVHLPIEDVSIPTPAWEKAWTDHGLRLHAILGDGGTVVVHCKGGIGWAGLVSARLLIEGSVSPLVAIRTVRAARPGAIETAAQERYLRELGSPRLGSF